MPASPAPETKPEAASIPRLARGLRLQWEEVPQAWVLLFPEGRVTLNGSAAEIMRRVDGQRSIGAITEELQQSFNEPDLAEDVLAAFELAQGVVQIDHSLIGNPVSLCRQVFALGR